MNHQFPDNDSLTRYLIDDLSDEERALFAGKLSENPDDIQLVEGIRNARKVASEKGRYELAGDITQVHRNVSDMIDRMNSDRNYTPNPNKIPSTSASDKMSVNKAVSSSWTTVAVATSLLVLAAVFGIKSFTSWQGTQSVYGLASVYSTPNGQRATLSLPDGSFAVLNVGSKLEVPANYGAGNRQVRLIGAAVFTVVNQDKQPFSVVTGSTTTRVLGTVFSVRRYETDTAVTVAVKEGRVSVQSEVVSANQSAIIGSAGNVVVTKMDNSGFDFMEGRLNIVNIPLSDAIVELSRWYDVDIRIGSASIEGQRIGGMFTSGSKENLVSVLENALGFRVVQRGRTITIYE